MRRLNYNPLGPDGFRELGHAVMLRILGPTYRPFSAGGADGQRDGVFVGTPLAVGLPAGRWVVQFKHHDVETVGARKARSRFLAEVRSELKNWRSREQKPDVLLFVTNILASGNPKAGLHDGFDTIVEDLGAPKKGGSVFLFDKARLDQTLDSLPEIRRVFDPITLEDAVEALGLGITFVRAREMTQNVRSSDIDLTTATIIVPRWRAAVVLAEIGNLSRRRITVRNVAITLDGTDGLEPDWRYVDTGTYAADQISGFPWATRQMPVLRSSELVRLAWRFRLPDASVEQVVANPSPPRGTVVFHFFPPISIAREMTAAVSTSTEPE